VTPYQLAQARLVREATQRLCEHHKKYGRKSLPTFMRGFVEGGIWALLIAGYITVPTRRTKIHARKESAK
jgi:hypothetical protein